MFQELVDAIINGQLDVIIAVTFISLVILFSRRLGLSYWLPLILSIILLVVAYFARNYFAAGQ